MEIVFSLRWAAQPWSNKKLYQGCQSKELARSQRATNLRPSADLSSSLLAANILSTTVVICSPRIRNVFGLGRSEGRIWQFLTERNIKHKTAKNSYWGQKPFLVFLMSLVQASRKAKCQCFEQKWHEAKFPNSILTRKGPKGQTRRPTLFKVP